MEKEFDCSLGEGGGQVLRTALSLATIQNTPVKLINIRNKRSKPGLRPQHLAAINLLACLTNSEIMDAKVGSESIVFIPGKIEGGNFNVNIGTAGSITLLLQTILLPCIFSPTKIVLRIKGGTDVPFSPPLNFLTKVLFPSLNKMGSKFECSITKRGYFPEGQGLINFKSEITKNPLKKIDLTNRGKLEKILIYSHSKGLPKDVTLNQIRGAKKSLPFETDYAEIIEHFEDRKIKGCGIDVFAYFSKAILSGNALGEKGKSALKVGRHASEKLLAELKTLKPCDSHLADQLIPFIALAKGKSIISTNKLTQHTLTNIKVTEEFLDVKFKVEGKLNQPAKISVKGLGFSK